MRKGRRYGTLLVSLETHRPVDLLPDRSAASLERWLTEHPGVEVISRDRAAEYAEGASRGAPQAVPVADRFHLLHNVVDLLQRLLERHQSAARAAGSGRRLSSPPPTEGLSPLNPHQQARRAAWRARSEAVKELQGQGLNVSAISRQVGLDRGTVRRWLRAEARPEPAPRRRQGSKLAPVVPYFQDQVAAGHHNATQLWRELRDQHQFTGWRRLVSPGWRSTVSTVGPSPATVRRPLSPRHVA